MADKTFNVKISEDLHKKVMQMIDSSGVSSKEWLEKAVVLTEIYDLNVVSGGHEQDFSELETHTTRIQELVANMIKRDIYLQHELAAKKEEAASFSASLENSNREMAELQKQIDDMRAANEKNQSLIGALSTLVAEQEKQLRNLKEEIDTKEKVMTSFAASLENSKIEIADLQNQLKEMNTANENKELLIGEYREKINSLNEIITVFTDRQNEQNAKEEISAQKAERKSQKKMLKRLLKKNPNATEKELAEQLGVDSSSIIELRKEFDI